MQNTTTFDLLTELENPDSIISNGIPQPLEILPAISAEAGMPPPILSANSLLLQQHEDMLLNLESISTEDAFPTRETKTVPATSYSASSNMVSNIKSGFRFLSHYVAVSGIVFAVLLLATNWSAYYAVAMNYLHPEGIAATNHQMQSTLSNSKITVYASEAGGTAFEKKEKAEDIKKQLDAENIKIDEEPFSMKNLLPTEPNISAKFDITPYENRIVIPRIGKNIPLVDISVTKSFDFDHMENIFMQELEKGVVRYPGSATPGERGNTFIFGHSSNYPWMKGGYNDVFALLDNVEFGDQIIVFYNQKKFVYTVREKKIVRPGDVKALERDPEARELSLMTCWPIGTTLKRMLVFAELTESP